MQKKPCATREEITRSCQILTKGLWCVYFWSKHVDDADEWPNEPVECWDFSLYSMHGNANEEVQKESRRRRQSSSQVTLEMEISLLFLRWLIDDSLRQRQIDFKCAQLSYVLQLTLIFHTQLGYFCGTFVYFFVVFLASSLLLCSQISVKYRKGLKLWTEDKANRQTETETETVMQMERRCSHVWSQPQTAGRTKERAKGLG